MMIPLFACSFIMLVFVFEKVISLRRGRVIPAPFVNRFLPQLREGKLDRDQAFELCQESKSPVADVFAGAVKKWGRPAVEVEQALIDAGERAAHRLRRYLRLFNGIATVSPLLGLLGTVFGMIHLFNAIATADAMGRTELLAGGISEALLTTAAGLGVAMPAMLFVPAVSQPRGSVARRPGCAGPRAGGPDFGRSPAGRSPRPRRRAARPRASDIAKRTQRLPTVVNENSIAIVCKKGNRNQTTNSSKVIQLPCTL